MPQLNCLDLRLNPVSEVKGYQPQLLRAGRAITKLDGLLVERSAVDTDEAGALTLPQLRTGVSMWHTDTGDTHWHLLLHVHVRNDFELQFNLSACVVSMSVDFMQPCKNKHWPLTSTHAMQARVLDHHNTLQPAA